MHTQLTYETGGNYPHFEIRLSKSEHKGVVVINYPGIDGDIDGYNGKYEKLAEHVAQSIGSVLRLSGPDYFDQLDVYHAGVVNKLESAIEYAIRNSQALAGVGPEDLEINLVGFSAGASGVAAISGRFPEIKKILLIAPGGDGGEEATREGLSKYHGEVYSIVGENDEIVGQYPQETFVQIAQSASKVRTLLIPDCNHQFMGTSNGKIMSAAPIWAFQKEGEGNIDPADGIVLY